MDPAQITFVIEELKEEEIKEIHEFRKERNIEKLYLLYQASIQKGHPAAQLLKNRKDSYDRRKEWWKTCLPCREFNNHDSSKKEIKFMKFVGRYVVNLLGDETINPYKTNKGSLDIRKDYDDDLFIWALLMNRMESCFILWKKGTNYICSALFASALMKALSKLADSEENMELSCSFSKHASYFEMVAFDLVTECFETDSKKTWGLLVNPTDQYGGITILEISARNELIEFMGHTACQSKLNSIWEGRIAHFTAIKKIIVCLFVPFLIPTITFVKSSAGSKVIDESKANDGYKANDESKSSDESKTNNGEKANDESKSKEESTSIDNSKSSDGSKFSKKPKSSIPGIYHTIRWTGLKSKGDSISIYHTIYLFYTAPVTKFWASVVWHMMFLAFFGFVVLTNLHPMSEKTIPKMELLILAWTLTILIEEIRQMLTTEQKSLLYKFVFWFQSAWNKFDAVMYLVFILAFILRFSLSAEQFVWARMTYSISLAIFILRTLHYFYVAKSTGPKVLMIGKMVNDIKFILMIFAVVLVSFGVVVQANLYPNSPPTWKLITDIVYIPYWQIFGELFLDNVEGKEPSICTSDPNMYLNETLPRCAERNALVPLCLAVYMVVTNILLVNLLIAIFSDTFQKVHNNSTVLWKFNRYSLVSEYYNKPALVPPFIILNHLFRVALCFYRKFKRRDEARNNFKIKNKNYNVKFGKEYAETFEIDPSFVDQRLYRSQSQGSQLHLHQQVLEIIDFLKRKESSA